MKRYSSLFPLDKATIVRERVLNAVTVGCFLLAVMLMGYREQLAIVILGAPSEFGSNYFHESVTRIIFLFGLAFGLSAASIFLLRYLRGDLLADDLDDEPNKQSNRPIKNEVRSRLDAAEAALQELQTTISVKVDPIERESVQALENSLAERLAKTLPDDVRRRISEDLVSLQNVEHVRALLQQTRSRLSGELNALGRRGNLNIVIGSLTTAVAVALLYQTATTPPPVAENIAELLTFYVPRVTLAAFVEVFSFFFLRLYRNGLEDLKYFHGEILNLDLKIAALETARLQNDAQIIGKVIENIVEADKKEKLAPLKKASEDLAIDPKLVTSVVEAALKLGKAEAKS